jgi:hypothetical protein
MTKEHKPPRVFMSYSHDSSEHKRWVAYLSGELRKNGIDVILDQWDLPLGGDATRFMEEGVRDADRVLVVCTEIYVRKADSRHGTAVSAMSQRFSRANSSATWVPRNSFR